MHTKRSVFKMNDTKEHIILLASKLFLQKNFKEVTMKELVNVTGLSKGAFYHYFKSKEQLFFEVLQYFFSCVNHDYESYSHESFYKFYHDYVKGTINLSNKYISKFDGEEDKGRFTINYFTLIFDALKLYPEYRKLMIQGINREIEIWAKRIEKARLEGEIRTVMTDQELAKTFMYLSDGVAMHMMMQTPTVEEMTTPYLVLWDKLYEQIKA